MTLRQTPGTLVLGLVAAITAHAVLFGGEHAMGGAYSGVFLQFAVAATAGLSVCLGVVLCSSARFAADGSILAARLAPALPGFPTLALATAGWFALGEHIEPAHAGVAAIAALSVLLLAAWVVLKIAGAVLRLLASVVFKVARLLTSCAAPVKVSLRVTRTLPPAQRDREWWCARFLRPPPVFANA